MMGIPAHRSETGKMFGRSRHTCTSHAENPSTSQLTHHLRCMMESPISDHAAYTVIQVQHRRETDIHPHCAQFSRHKPATAFGKPAAHIRVLIVKLPKQSRRRQQSEAITKALHAATFLIYRHQQWRYAQSVNALNQCSELIGVRVIASKENDTAHQRMIQKFPIHACEFSSSYIYHQWTDAHAELPACANTAMDSTWAVCGNI